MFKLLTDMLMEHSGKRRSKINGFNYSHIYLNRTALGNCVRISHANRAISLHLKKISEARILKPG